MRSVVATAAADEGVRALEHVERSSLARGWSSKLLR